MVRNQPNAKKAKRSYVANMVGTGITPRANTGNKKLNARIDQAFAEWCDTSDADGQLTFYGQQGLVAGTMFESGEVLARFRDRPRKGDEIPFKVQLLEPDYLDGSRFGRIGSGAASNFITQGKEFTEAGELVAYYLWNEHPGDMAAGLRMQSLKSLRVPADQIAHVFRVDRPGQIRGVTELAAGMQQVYDLAEFEEAERMRKKIASCFTAFVTQSGGSTTPLGATETDEKKKQIERIAPGLIQYLRSDQKVEFGKPPSAEGYREYTVAQWHAIAAGWGITYEELTGDFSNVNYSSYRGAHNGYRRSIEMDQWLILIPMFGVPTWRRFIDRLVITGVIARPAYGVEWETPRFESIDPVKDSIADRNDVRSGFVSRRQVIRRRGDNPDQVTAEIAEDAKDLDAKQLILDTDPRRVSNGGQVQQPPKDDKPANPGGDGGDDE